MSYAFNYGSHQPKYIQSLSGMCIYQVFEHQCIGPVANRIFYTLPASALNCATAFEVPGLIGL